MFSYRWNPEALDTDHSARFDVIAILMEGDSRFTIEHIKNAFELAY